MSAKDHPDNAPGLPMLFPAWLDRLQMKYVNPVFKRVGHRLPAFAIVEHRGRRSGRDYETVVNAFRKGGVLAILLGHGKTDWVKNVVAAGEAEVRLSGRTVRITNPRVLPAGTDDERLPRVARLGVRRMGVFMADIA
ncbi:nitroreductase family deazaflavin-dependent oxidoreductase [Nocardia mexicana]|uniref:Deazaflavin-dependent oxidoreductase (Nitroreductase family) n=1 Tax=Nocardia mexicana TaxID=279262 RepID=A0A370H412_9NOCA|nr:nitroreductase family deazaflavin-dependent oxidoreductase [Nocardia mexicana]RDI50903.1 deazaflavin-dependent oxidoreductase (nitroreductase family) [Nocardia mexicana]